MCNSHRIIFIFEEIDLEVTYSVTPNLKLNINNYISESYKLFQSTVIPTIKAEQNLFSFFISARLELVPLP